MCSATSDRTVATPVRRYPARAPLDDTDSATALSTDERGPTAFTAPDGGAR